MASGAPLPYAESGWERSLALPKVDAKFVTDRLARWPELAGRPWRVLGGGLRTLNLRIGDDRVVRLALTPEHDLRKEAALLALLRAEIGVPRVFDFDETALLLEFVPHEDLPASSAAAARVGRTAAIIHRHLFPRSGFLDEKLRVPAPFETAFDGLRAWAEGILGGRAGERLGELARGVARSWSAQERSLRAACAVPCLVHGDFKPANVKWRTDGGDVVVLDWEFAWAGPALLDLGQFLRWGAPEPFVEALARSYREAGGELPHEWRRSAELLDLFNLVGFLDHEDSRPVRDRDVLRRIHETLAR